MNASGEVSFTKPLCFHPVFMKRVWGGRRLEALYRKNLPPELPIGESWELVDRPEAQSLLRDGCWHGRTLHDLWVEHRPAVFGEIADSPRFPLLIKLLDARERLSLQVHPSADAAAALGGEPKTEFWYIADAEPGAELYVGLKNRSSRAEIEKALADSTIEDHLHRIPVRSGDSMFLPSGRMHAIGAGIVIVEIQQNSDTTYRIYDWARPGLDGGPRELHLEQSLRSIDFLDSQPTLVESSGESLVSNPLFKVEKWILPQLRKVGSAGKFAIVVCLTGQLECAGVAIAPGELMLIPACLQDRVLHPTRDSTSLLRVTASN